MPDYLIEGKKGAGKSLIATSIMRDYMLQNRKVATNLNLFLHELINVDAKEVRCVRIPDHPTLRDLDCLGVGNETIGTKHYDEGRNGALVLDELATWFNARTYADKGRQEVIDWLLHARKLGWDVYYLCQSIEMIDKQARTGLVEYVASCRRADRLVIPFLSPLMTILTLGFVKLRLPRVHMAVVRYGTGGGSLVADRWYVRGTHLFKGYDTFQRFKADPDAASYSYLPPYYTHGWKAVKRYRDVRRQLAERRRITGLQRAGLITFDEWRVAMKKT